MTKYREILRLNSLDFSERSIAASAGMSRNTISKVLKCAKELDISWPLDHDMTDSVLEEMLFPKDGRLLTIKRFLIIDEWLLLKPTEIEQHDILELLHRRRKKSSTIFCAQYDTSGWYNQLGGDDSPLAESILDRIKHDAYKINIIPTDPTSYKSTREVYGLDPTLSE